MILFIIFTFVLKKYNEIIILNLYLMIVSYHDVDWTSNIVL